METTTNRQKKTEITIDGAKAVFNLGDPSYTELIYLLRHGRSREMLERTGGPISFSHRTRCGELVIRNYGITSRFPIYRGSDNEKLYWIALPKLTSPGKSIPLFTADPRVIDLVKAKKGNWPGSAD